MRKLLAVILLLALLAVFFWAGSLYKQRETSRVDHSAVKPPAVRSDVNPDTATDTDIDTSTLPPGAVRISPEKQQSIGVRVEAVEKKVFTHTLRVLGRVTADENLVYRMTVASDGWIREIFPLTEGSPIKKGQPLASCYSRDLVILGQTYINALDLLERFPDSGKTILPGQHVLPRATPPRVAVEIAEDGLRSLGMGEMQLEEMKRTGQLVQYVILVSPATGFVLARNVSPGQWFDRGTELYRIADLSRVWIFADLYGSEAQHLRPGMKLKASLPDQRKMFQAQVSDVLPLFDPNTRTLKVRLEADNPGYFLRPDMFVDVELPITLPPSINVPADAIIYSGLRKTVFVDRGNGFFEPRKVETGWRLGNRVEIVRGLMVGEKIVLSGNFFIDSESRLQAAGQGIYGAMSIDPVCGMEVDEARAKATRKTSVYYGTTYYFCAMECKEQFDKDPGRFVVKPSGMKESSSPKTHLGAGHD